MTPIQSELPAAAVARSETFARLARAMADVLAVAPGDLSDDSSPTTIPSWDSLNHLNLVMAIEEEFRVSLSPDDTLAMSSVEHIRTVLRGYGVEI